METLDNLLVTEEINDLFRFSTGDPNLVHDPEYMKGFGKYPIVLGTFIESIALKAVKDMVPKDHYLVSLETSFKDFLSVGERFSMSIDPKHDEFGTGTYDVTVSKKDGEKQKDVAQINLVFSYIPETMPGFQPINPNIFSYDLLLTDLSKFSKALGPEEDNCLEFTLASRSGVIAQAAQTGAKAYPGLEILKSDDLFPIYAKHSLKATFYLQSVDQGSRILANLLVGVDNSSKRPVVNTEVLGYNAAREPLYHSKAVIQTIPRKIVFGKMLKDLPKN